MHKREGALLLSQSFEGLLACRVDLELVAFHQAALLWLLYSQGCLPHPQICSMTRLSAAWGGNRQAKWLASGSACLKE